MFNSSAFVHFLEQHIYVPHVSKYHSETYVQHCLLVIDEMSKRTTDCALLIAACMHDIAKPRTQGINKIGEPCFYDHELITDDELQRFIDPDDARYEYVKALVLCHMNPYYVHTASDYDKSLRKYCRKSLIKAGSNIEVDDTFIRDVSILHDSDQAGTVKHDDELEGVAKRCESAYRTISTLT